MMFDLRSPRRPAFSTSYLTHHTLYMPQTSKAAGSVCCFAALVRVDVWKVVS